ncbi:MAG: hypothetical protein JWO60_2464 [Frankiales bacterium]|nr:hypothetical protein [Frankiales bacterium]
MSTAEDSPRVGRPPAHLAAHLGEIISVVAADGTVLSVNQAPADRVAQEPPSSALGWVHPDDQHVVVEAFTTLLTDPDARTRTLVRVSRDGQPYRHMETSGINRLDDPEVGGLVFVSRDVEDRVQLARTVEQSLQAQRLVAALGVRLLVHADLTSQLDTVLRQTAELLEAPYLALHERADGGELRITRMHGSRPLPPGHLQSALGPRARENVARGVVSTAEARLEGPAGAIGVLVAGWTEDHAFDEVQRQLLQGVANVLAGARQREQREVEAVVKALHDPLTGLPTRPLLLDRLDHALQRSARDGSEVGVLVVDLDRFKEVNDRFGHAAGDAVLAELGVRLADHVRPGDTAARLGGDEFVVLCEDIPSPEVVLDLRDRLRLVFARPYDVPGVGRLVLSGSLGAAFSSTTGRDRSALLHAADQAMYRDKRQRS